MNRSPDRSRGQMQRYIERCQAKGKVPRSDYLDMYRKEIENDLLKEQDQEWRKYNLEHDLRSTQWICAKAKAREEYAQNLYAAMCNNNFQKLDVWPLLKGQTWSCSWRYAGGIVADMRESGDYMDWYCTGITMDMASEDDLAQMSKQERDKYDWYQANFVGESTVTHEVQEDLKKLGWTVIQEP